MWRRWSFFEKGEKYAGFDEEKWEVEDEIATREKNWDIPVFFICDIVGLNNCNGAHVVVQS